MDRTKGSGEYEGTSLELLKRRYGPGKSVSPFQQAFTGWTVFTFKSGGFTVPQDGPSKRGCTHFCAGFPPGRGDLPRTMADEPEKLAKEAGELADGHRAFALEFFSKMRDTATAGERNWVRELVDRSQPELHWTANEHRLMLGDERDDIRPGKLDKQSPEAKPQQKTPRLEDVALAEPAQPVAQPKEFKNSIGMKLVLSRQASS